MGHSIASTLEDDGEFQWSITYEISRKKKKNPWYFVLIILCLYMMNLFVSGSIVSQLLNLMKGLLKDYVLRFVGPTKLGLDNLSSVFRVSLVILLYALLVEH